MAQAKGISGEVLIDFETTYGSDPGAAAATLMPFNPPFGLSGRQNMSEPGTIRGRRDAVEPIFGYKDIRGSAVVPVDVLAFGYWLRALLGAPVTTGTGPYTHTYKPASSIESMVVELGFTDISQYFKFNGVKLDGMSIATGGDGELTASLDLVGANVTAAGSSYDGSPTEPAFTRFQQSQAAVEEGGSGSSIMKMVELNIRNNLDPDSYVIGGGGLRGDLPEGICHVTGKVTALFEDLTLYNKALNGTESSLQVEFTNGTNVLTIDLPEVKYQLASPAVPTQGGIYVELDFSAYYENNADTAVLKVTLVNGQSAYS